MIRKKLRLVVGLAVLLCSALVVATLAPVDHRPYFRQSYYTETLDRLHARSSTNSTVSGPLLAGFGKAKLTPEISVGQDIPSEGKFKSLPLAGYGSRAGRPARGVHDDLFVKAVAFKVADRIGVMIGADALIVPWEVTAMASSNLLHQAGLKREQIYLSASHTHCSVGAWGEGLVAEQFAGSYQPGIRVWFADRIVTAVKLALADLKPAEIGSGRFLARDFVKNRLVGDLGNVDAEFSYVAVKQKSGKSAVLGSFSAHATVLGSDMMDFSADYPGFWQRQVEESTGGFAVFLAGGVGSHGPRAPTRGLEGAEGMGQALARLTVEHVSHATLTNVIAFDLLGIDVTLPPLNTRVSDSLRLRPWIARKLLPVRTQTYLQGFRLANTIWVSTPCDFSGEMALSIKDLLRARGADAVVTSFNGDYIGYVIPCRYYHLDGYEPRVMSFFGPNVPDYLDELIRRMAASMITPRANASGL